MNNIAGAFVDPVLVALPRIPQAILTLALGILIVYIFKWIFEKVLKVSRTPVTLRDILSNIAEVVLWAILLSAVFQSLGLQQIAIAFSGSVAIVGLAIATGSNALVQDVISGLFLARDRDFSVGYQIKMGDIEGIIRHIDVRKVRIEDPKGLMHIVPNSVLDKASWVVINKHPKEKKK